METVWLPQGSLNRILSEEDGPMGLASALAEMVHAPLGSPRHGSGRYVGAYTLRVVRVEVPVSRFYPLFPMTERLSFLPCVSPVSVLLEVARRAYESEGDGYDWGPLLRLLQRHPEVRQDHCGKGSPDRKHRVAGRRACWQGTNLPCVGCRTRCLQHLTCHVLMCLSS